MSVAAAGGGAYRIEDEPLPSGLSHLAVHPLWPLLAVMLGGAWLAWPWFAVNGFALGSPTRRRELAWVVGGFAGTFVIVAALGLARLGGLPEGLPFELSLVSIAVWKLLVSYRLYTLQGRCFELYTYFGGAVRSGLPLVALGWFGERALFPALPGLLQVILG